MRSPPHLGRLLNASLLPPPLRPTSPPPLRVPSPNSPRISPCSLLWFSHSPTPPRACAPPSTFAAAPGRRRCQGTPPGRMRRQGQGQGQYGESEINSMVAAQLHHYQTQQRVQQYPDNNYPGREPGKSTGEQQYTAPKARQSQWDRGGPNIPNQIPPYAYNEGQSAQGAQSFYDGQRPDLKVSLEKQPSKESRDQPHNDRFEARHEDYNLPRTFDGLEQNFHEDIVILSKELHDAEDAENARHRERLNEINAQYQEKLLALRARQATYREEFLRKESLARQQQYQQARLSNYTNNVMPGEPHGYTPTAAVTPPPHAAAATAGGTYGEAHRGYASAQYDSFRERPDYPEFRGRGRGQGHGLEHRGQFPGGRTYNSGGRRF